MTGIDFDTAGKALSVQAPGIARESSPGIEIIHITFPTHQEMHLSLHPVPNEQPLAMIHRLTSFLKKHKLIVVRHEIFGSLAIHGAMMQGLQKDFQDLDWPVTWVEGSKTSIAGISGMHVFAVAGTRVGTIRQNGIPIARVFHDGYFKHCLLGGIGPSNPNALKSEQCWETFNRLEDILGEAGMNMTNTTRTWFFLENILDWYYDFNQIRIDFFRQTRVLEGILPASTGIGGRNSTGNALIAGAWAVQAEKDSAKVREVISPMQCPATNYGSGFSRAVLLETEAWKRLLISGTASIAENGSSLHAGDLGKQISMSMTVIRAIFKSNGFDFDDIIRGTSYYKDSLSVADLESPDVGCSQFVKMRADICRPELLYEFESDAFKFI